MQLVAARGDEASGWVDSSSSSSSMHACSSRRRGTLLRLGKSSKKIQKGRGGYTAAQQPVRRFSAAFAVPYAAVAVPRFFQIPSEWYRTALVARYPVAEQPMLSPRFSLWKDRGVGARAW